MILMSEEDIKRRMLENLQSSQENAQKQQAEETLKNAMPHILDEKARERLSNLKLVKPDLAMQLEFYLFQLYQTGQVKEKITEEQLIMVLKKLSEKRDFKITRK